MPLRSHVQNWFQVSFPKNYSRITQLSQPGSSSDCAERFEVFCAFVVLWPRVLGEKHSQTVQEFLKVYRLTKNPRSDVLFTFQVRKKVKCIHLRSTFSSNKKWKNSFFYASGNWEYSPSEAVEGLRVPRETRVPSAEGKFFFFYQVNLRLTILSRTRGSRLDRGGRGSS